MKFCPECGVKLVGDAPKFCGECGHKLAIVGAMPTDRPNSELSDEELRAKADAGDAEAIKDVGLRFERAGDTEMARQWYERAADLGHGGAMRNLGVLRTEVDDHEGALAWFIRAADSGSDLTMDRNSITVSRPVTVSARAASQAALELFKMNRLDEAEQWIKRSQDMDDNQAAAYIAVYLYEEETDYARALEWAIRSSDEGDVRGTALVLGILSQTERYIEMAPYLERYIETDPEFTVATQENLALFACMAGLQFGVEGDFSASRSWLKQAQALGHPEAAGYLATEANEEAKHPGTSSQRLSELATHQDSDVRWRVAGNSSTPMQLLSVLAGESVRDVRDAALLNPACPKEILEASGLVFMFAIQLAEFGHARVNMLVTRSDFTRDLASSPVEVLYPGYAEDYEVLAAAGVLDYDVVERPSNDTDYLVWCGSSAPDWWSDWSLINDFLGEGALAALARGDATLFGNNKFTPAERVAFAGHEATNGAWAQARTDLGRVLKESSESSVLGEVARRWLYSPSWREVSTTTHRAIASALACHPNTPAGVLEELAVSDVESVRWLITRNPSATDEMRAAAVLLGVDDATFTRELPDDDIMDVSYDGVHVAVLARAWTREEFTEQFPEVFDDPEDGWVTPDGQVAIDTRISEAPDEMSDYLQDSEELDRGYESTYGSVTHLEVL